MPESLQLIAVVLMHSLSMACLLCNCKVRPSSCDFRELEVTFTLTRKVGLESVGPQGNCWDSRELLACLEETESDQSCIMRDLSGKLHND